MTQLLFKNGIIRQNLAHIAGKLAISVQILAFCALFGTTAGKTIPFPAHILVFKTIPLVANCLKTLPFMALKLAKMVP